MQFSPFNTGLIIYIYVRMLCGNFKRSSGKDKTVMLPPNLEADIAMSRWYFYTINFS